MISNCLQYRYLYDNFTKINETPFRPWSRNNKTDENKAAFLICNTIDQYGVKIKAKK